MKTANETYKERMLDAEQQLDRIKELLENHKGFQAERPENWTYAGDLDYVNEMLGEVIKFLK